MKREYNISIIKPGMVFAGNRSGDIHNEIMSIRKENGTTGRTMCEVEQYGATLATQNHNKRITFFATEIIRALNRGNAHVILVR